MKILILGCGVVGTLAGNRLTRDGHRVIGVRRHPEQLGEWEPVAEFPVVAGDIADPGLADHGPAAITNVAAGFAVLLAANPGVRRGRDNGLVPAVRQVTAWWPDSRLVYTGTTSVYGDAAGATIQEDGPLGDDPESLALRGIEDAVLAHPGALILRATALVGPTRQHARTRALAARASGVAGIVKGDPERPFSWLHEADLADLACLALTGVLGSGVLNAAAPDDGLTVAGYYRHQAGDPTLAIQGDGTFAPRRRIGHAALVARLPTAWRWRSLDD